MKDKGHRFAFVEDVNPCTNEGCTWICIPGGIPGDARIRYAERLGERPILAPRQCEGKKP